MLPPDPKLLASASAFIESQLAQGFSTSDIINAFSMRICSKLAERRDEAGVTTLMVAGDSNRIWLEQQGFKIGRRL
jgi:predicted dinucleotide-binding enzyme